LFFLYFFDEVDKHCKPVFVLDVSFDAVEDHGVSSSSSALTLAEKNSEFMLTNSPPIFAIRLFNNGIISARLSISPTSKRSSLALSQLKSQGRPRVF
jgi:hypothetical protein